MLATQALLRSGERGKWPCVWPASALRDTKQEEFEHNGPSPPVSSVPQVQVGGCGPVRRGPGVRGLALLGLPLRYRDNSGDIPLPDQDPSSRGFVW
jgi:hypothetical protein